MVLSVVICLAGAGHCESFSFAVIADPHLNGSEKNKARFVSAVRWIIDNKEKKDIELVFVVGDIGWGGLRKSRNLRTAETVLAYLNHAGVPYVPVIGDNEIQKGSEKEFNDIFQKQYEYLSKMLKNWRKASTPVGGKYLQNFSFDYKGCHFVCCDFNSRDVENEGGELHDFPGGSWPWFKKDIENCPKDQKENIVIISHIGMFRTGFGSADEFLFSEDEMNKVKGFLYDYRDYVDSNYAGHIHQNWHSVVWTGLFTTIYHVRTTDETWHCRQWPESDDKDVTVRVVEVNGDAEKIVYSQNLYNAEGTGRR
jgi:hypothetical protein